MWQSLNKLFIQENDEMPVYGISHRFLLFYGFKVMYGYGLWYKGFMLYNDNIISLK